MEFNLALGAHIASALGDPGPGVPADRPDLHGDLPGLPAALGRGAARIHSLPLPVSPQFFDLEAAVEERLEAGLIDPSTLPEPYDRYSAADLVAHWKAAPVSAQIEDPVCTVGWLTVDRFLLNNGEACGIAGGPFGLLANRHLDLAVLHASIHEKLGAEAVFGFYEAYGTDPSILELDRYTTAAYLLGWLPGPE